MIRQRWLLGAIGLLLAVLPARLGAQVDVAKALIGTWIGDVQTVRGEGNMNRTLVVQSVSETSGGWALKGHFGRPGEKLSQVSGTVDNAGGQVILKLTTGGQSEITLRLHDDKHLIGTLTPVSRSGRGHGRERDEALRLEKVE